MRYLMDTSFLIGLANTKDKYHEFANEAFNEIENLQNSEIYISDYVINEFLNIILKISSIEDAIEWGQILYSQEFANIIYCNKEINESAWKIFQQEKGERKPLNFTDCVIYVKYVILKCDVILTYDERLKNFDQPL